MPVWIVADILVEAGNALIIGRFIPEINLQAVRIERRIERNVAD